METHACTYIGSLTICISDECIGGLGGSGDNSQFGGFMCLSSEPTVIIERLCFTGSGGGSSLTYMLMDYICYERIKTYIISYQEYS